MDQWGRVGAFSFICLGHNNPMDTATGGYSAFVVVAAAAAAAAAESDEDLLVSFGMMILLLLLVVLVVVLVVVLLVLQSRNSLARWRMAQSVAAVEA